MQSMGIDQVYRDAFPCRDRYRTWLYRFRYRSEVIQLCLQSLAGFSCHSLQIAACTCLTAAVIPPYAPCR
jgi:hypothetical protein